MLKNVTITLTEEAAHWARRRAADENTSVSRLVGAMLETEMRQSGEYQKAYRRWRKLGTLNIDAEHRLTREAAHGRR